MPKSKGVNTKKAAGLERKAANKAEKDAATARERERIEAEDWKKGSNSKKAERDAAQAQKSDEQARKRAEKAALLAEEEANMGAGASASKARKAASNTKSKKKKQKDGLSLLEDALVGDADKKLKAAKRAERMKREKEERLRMERERKKAEESKNVQDPLLANTAAMIGNSLVEDDRGLSHGGGRLNASLEKGEIDASGIDSALKSMSVAGGKDDDHPEKRMKALHKAFEERMMPEMKQQYPGLKRSQYLEKIFALWKKSPENPQNWARTQD
mmetsp:Transcript_10071/g.12715  ORF Transcript_10071/g.12715 Transcript_10071/m.12715 type:complete len:272 (-) Transcript_10071:110-925(-)|eukprot:CAMPEP_0203643550 /NCGR_PEP_ID=MMETSP0088-20131115/8998_1 /ASSEMBLY_ACC=CAM_ASM_001087 /TAXON_ID=426623 /ORGANISM="Chaetoceros affinis, Strain CCMP159" /LENGTH=271 /DNA_ID=CAMNT_0050499763 /DNA_START=64 /DNA_END=879 /DNA_ORIENTATION=-